MSAGTCVACGCNVWRPISDERIVETTTRATKYSASVKAGCRVCWLELMADAEIAAENATIAARAPATDENTTSTRGIAAMIRNHYVRPLPDWRDTERVYRERLSDCANALRTWEAHASSTYARDKLATAWPFIVAGSKLDANLRAITETAQATEYGRVDVETATGEALDAIGAEYMLPRFTGATAHALRLLDDGRLASSPVDLAPETDESYRDRLRAAENEDD